MKSLVKIILITVPAFVICMLIFSIQCTPAQGGDNHTHPHSHGSGEGHSHSHGSGGHTHTHSGPAYTYLAMNGEFQMNPNDSLTQNDPRNPSRLVLKTSEEKGTMTRMAFYAHDDMQKKLAECGYQFVGSRPDPFYYPEKSKTSIWDVFEKVEDYEGDCAAYKYVISRSPHGEPIHMHLRYGNDIDELLALSNAPEDNAFNPWWSTYCDIERTTLCD
ncbi:MAG: hypothetical protein MRY78_12340 [Saprospiraceae bacterium]|nr:hypothetical protein [Saprospiraceae bacterium]